MATTALGAVLHNLRRSLLRRDEAGLTDGDLLECFITRRDEGAFEALVRRHGPMVLGVCRRILGLWYDGTGRWCLGYAGAFSTTKPMPRTPSRPRFWCWSAR